MGLALVPRQLFLTRGVGVHREPLTSFELALRDAGIEQYNLVTVSSIFPPGCQIVSKEEGIAHLSPGEVVFVVMSRNSTNEPGRVINTSIGVAIPMDSSTYGYLSEHHGYGQTEQQSGDYAEDLAASMLATTLGIEFDPDNDYDERRAQYQMSGKIVDTQSITQISLGDDKGRWTTVVAAAVLILDPNP